MFILSLSKHPNTLFYLLNYFNGFFASKGYYKIPYFVKFFLSQILFFIMAALMISIFKKSGTPIRCYKLKTFFNWRIIT